MSTIYVLYPFDGDHKEWGWIDSSAVASCLDEGMDEGTLLVYPDHVCKVVNITKSALEKYEEEK